MPQKLERQMQFHRNIYRNIIMKSIKYLEKINIINKSTNIYNDIFCSSYFGISQKL